MKANLAVYRVFRYFVLAVAVAAMSAMAFADSPDPGKAAAKVRMVDLGAKSCIPCKMMAPVMEALEKDYQGRAEIVFIDVRENPAEAARFGIRAIPTQIFYDRHGVEAYRHEGFFDRQPIAEILDRLLADR
jgi:thioredoxin 1